MAGSSNIKHVRYRFKQGDVSTGNVDYSTCYFENNTDDVLLSAELSPMLESIGIDSPLPEIDFDNDNLTRLLAIYGARDRFLVERKVSKVDTSTIAVANKLLYLDAAGKLPTTAANADKLGGKDINYFVSKTELNSLSNSLSNDINLKVDKTDTSKIAAANKLIYLDATGKLPATAANADKLGGNVVSYFATKTELDDVSNSLSNDVILKAGGGAITDGWLDFKDYEGLGMGYGIRWVDKDHPSRNYGFLNKTRYSGTAYAAEFDVEGREFTTAYAKKTDVPAVWDSDGHLVSPAGWSLWVVNEDPAPPVVEIVPPDDKESSSGSGTEMAPRENDNTSENPTT